MNRKTLLLLVVISFSLCVATMAQSELEFTEKTDHYRITLVDNWRPLAYTDSLGRQKTEFVFQQRDQGLLKIGKAGLEGMSLSNLVQNDLEDLKLRVACVYIGQEIFRGGQLNGIRVALYYFEDNHQTAGTYYYLQEDANVWILRFTARGESPGMARKITDRMTRSFCSVCPIP